MSRMARLLIVAALVLGSLGSATPFSPVDARGEDVCDEPNDTFQSACYLSPSSPIPVGFISHPGDTDAYRFEVVDFDQGWAADLSYAPFGYRMEIADWNGQVIASSTDGHLTTPLGLPGSYYLFVDSPTGQFSDSQPYSFLLRPGQDASGDPLPQILFASDYRDQPGAPTYPPNNLADFITQGGKITVDMKVGGAPDDSRGAGTYLGPRVADFTMTADTRVVRPSDGPFLATIVFRAANANNFYALDIDPREGRAMLRRQLAGQRQPLSDWVSNEAIDTSGGVNRTVIRAQGTDIRVHVNGQRIIHVADGTPLTGEFAIGLLTFGSPPAMGFDNVLITTPGRAR